MLKIENFEVVGWEHAIRGMRNPMNSWDKSDSRWSDVYEYDPDPSYMVKYEDHKLMMKLAKAGPVHGKFMRMIAVYVDITAPLYWWKEFDTYKVGTVANSCSTMHKIHTKEFELSDFSHEQLMSNWINDNADSFVFKDVKDCEKAIWSPIDVLSLTINILNVNRKAYLKSNNKKFWWQMIQLLPSSYNQKRTIMLNYEVLSNIYKNRRNHKLDEWREFCQWIEELPNSNIITCSMTEV